MDAGKKRILYWLFFALLLILAAAAAMVLLPEYHHNQDLRGKLAELEERKAERTAARNRLLREVDDLENSPRAIERVAREKFGFCRPGERVMRYDTEPPRGR